MVENLILAAANDNQQMMMILGGAILVVGLVFFVYVYTRTRKQAVAVHHKIREIKANIKACMETFDSRVQWIHQDGTEFQVVKY